MGLRVYEQAPSVQHVLRPLLSAIWLRARGRLPTRQDATSRGGERGADVTAATRALSLAPTGTDAAGGGRKALRWPPLRLVDLADDMRKADLPAEVRNEIGRMLELQERPQLAVVGPALPLLDGYIEACIDDETMPGALLDAAKPARGVDEEVAAAASFAAWDGFCVELLEALTSER